MSLGSQREFWVALRRSGEKVEALVDHVVEVDLADGDVLTMEGMCQKHCLHFVPCDARHPTHSLRTFEEAAAAYNGVTDHPRESLRINVTFRWIRSHKRRCKHV